MSSWFWGMNFKWDNFYKLPGTYKKSEVAADVALIIQFIYYYQIDKLFISLPLNCHLISLSCFSSPWLEISDWICLILSLSQKYSLDSMSAKVEPLTKVSSIESLPYMSPCYILDQARLSCPSPVSLLRRSLLRMQCSLLFPTPWLYIWDLI